MSLIPHSNFSDFAQSVANFSGRPLSFYLALGTVLIWGITGPIFDYSNTWQLVINTGTTIITFLMVFLIQSTQNRDGEALQIKIDELIRAHAGAHNVLLDLEELSPEQIKSLKKRYEDLAEKARQRLESGETDTSVEDDV